MCHQSRGLRCMRMVARAALRDSPAKKSFRARHGEQRSNAHATRGFTKDRYIAGITAKGCYIIVHPFKRGGLVKQTTIGVPIAQIEKSIDSKAIVQRHAHHAIARE